MASAMCAGCMRGLVNLTQIRATKITTVITAENLEETMKLRSVMGRKKVSCGQAILVVLRADKAEDMKNRTGLTRERILNLLKEHEPALKRYTVKRMGLFGSYARDEARQDSDVDLIVEFTEPTFDHFMDLTSYLEQLLGRKVEVLTPEGVRSIRVKAVAHRIKESAIYV